MRIQTLAVRFARAIHSKDRSFRVSAAARAVFAPSPLLSSKRVLVQLPDLHAAFPHSDPALRKQIEELFAVDQRDGS